METEEKSGSSFKAKIIAGVVLAVAAYVLFHVVLGLLSAIGGFLLIVIAVIAVIWAINVLF
jgi:UPF0716 family protein affecting phage T7 exclusion